MSRSLIVASLGALLFAACNQPEGIRPADIVLLNGGIYTVDSNRSWAQAAAIRDGRFVAVGENETVRNLVGPETLVYDLAGRMALPGFVDSHVHPLEGGYESVYCNLWDHSSVAEVKDALLACDRASDPEDAWLQAVGLDLGLFGINGPDKSLLDGVAEGKFVFVDAVDGHAALVNDKVLNLVGFSAVTADPVGGVIERRPGSNEPNGTIRETARHAVDVLRPERDLETSLGAMSNAVERMNAVGITAAYDAWVGEHEMIVYKALDDIGALSLFVMGAIIDEGVYEKHSGADLERVIEKHSRYESDNIRHNAIKFMVDGVFEGETGAVLEPYDTTGDLGVLNHEPAELNERVARYYDMDFSLHFHTMGDRAARAALDALEHARVHGDPALHAKRHALSHLGLVDPGDYGRFAEQNAAAAITAVWGYASKWTVKLEIPALGQERVDRLYPIRSLDESGAVVVGSSDWNYGELDPLLSIETAITRLNPFEPSEFVASTAEAVDLATMIEAYTTNGAWLMQRDDDTGSIETGKLADLVILDTNLFEIEPEAISEARVDVTFYRGQVVYVRD